MREKVILRALSENSRTSLSNMAKLAGCSYVTVGKILDKLVEKLDIRFVLELDFTKLGFWQRHILLIKFSKKPSQEWLESILKDDNNVSVAYLSAGQFDLVVIAMESDPVKYLLWEFLFMQKLSDYDAEVKSSDMPYFIFGYLPIDNTFIERVNVKMKKEDKLLLKLLNENSRMGYHDLARQLDMSESTVRYKLFNLVKNGIIKRFTIAVQNPPNEFILGVFEQWTSFTKNFEEKAALERKHMLNMDEPVPLLTIFQVAAPLCGSYGNFIIGLFDSMDDAIENVVKKHRNFYKKEKYEEKHAKIIKPLKGIFPFRNLDIKTNYNLVKWE